MSQENVEIVRQAFEALAARGVEGAMEFVAPDGVWYTSPEWVEASDYRGHDGMRFLFSVWTDNFDNWTIDLSELLDAGDSVVALIEHGGKIKGTNVPVHQPMGIMCSNFRQGQFGEAHFFQTWREALEAAGLRE